LDTRASSESPGELSVVLVSRQRRWRVDRPRLRGLLCRAAVALGVSGEVALVLMADRAMRDLSRRFRNVDRPTDVLSFPGAGGEAGLGDIVISVETADRNARDRGHPLAVELDVLALHGFLHVLGHDHERDDGSMDRLERRLRRRLLQRVGAAGAGGSRPGRRAER
jgi:probable rRNA maturation factor